MQNHCFRVVVRALLNLKVLYIFAHVKSYQNYTLPDPNPFYIHCSCVTHIHSAQRRNKCKYNSFQNGGALRLNCIMHAHLRERNYSYLIPNPHELEFIIHIWLQSTKPINSMNAGFSVYSFPYVQYIHVRKNYLLIKRVWNLYKYFELNLRQTL